ncbi:MAG: cobalt transporter CbiM [Tepidiformaceae bacterium]
MHIPDGYLSPATCAVGYAAAVPFWGIAVARVRKFVGGRTVPLLAIFSAFTFAIMMFNIPVPGGTTAHGVGGTLTAIVLGPWAAVISTSVALIIQALFFGDGGITAIGANCLNMGVILPMAGYFAYKLIAGRSGMLTQRRIIAAAIGSYVGITLAAIAVGLELGIQPHFWSTNGVPDYSPYGFSTAIPAMLLSHMLGASFVEAAITALGLSYLQKSYPEILLRRQKRSDVAPSVTSGRSPWIPAVGLTAVAVVAIFIGGFIKGGESIGSWAGLDWSTVSTGDVVGTLLVSSIVTAVALPLLFVGLRNAKVWRAPLMIFVAILIWVPIGLIAPGGAFAEETSATQAEVTTAIQAKANGDSTLFDALPDINQECECVPSNINNVSFSSGTVFAGYQPPWVSPTDPAWKQNVGYQFAGFAGMAALALLAFAMYRVTRWLAPTAPPDWRTAEE